MARQSKKKGNPEVAVAEAKTSNTVMVCLNHPRSIAFPMPDGHEVVIQGSAYSVAGKDMGVIEIGKCQKNIIDAEDWEYIKKQYAHLKLLKNGFLFVVPNPGDYDDMAKDHGTLRTGMEPIDTEKTTSKPAED
jgi:hypothetical protein